MKRVLLFAVLVLLLMLCLVGCSDRSKPTLVYMVDGETYHTDVLDSKDEFFGNIGKEPEKSGFLFGGWYYDEGTWEKPLGYTDLNKAFENKEYYVYAKWETVDLLLLEEERAYAVIGLLNGAESEVVIPKSYKDMPVILIASGAFRGNEELTSVTIPDTVRIIEEYAFAECTALEKIVLTNSIQTVERGAFSNCNSLTEVVFSTALTEIQAEAFANCTKLTSVSLPASIKTIGAHAFFSCTALNSVSIPLGIAKIGREAFEKCAVTEISFAGTMESFAKISQESFAEGSAITGVKCIDGVLSITE